MRFHRKMDVGEYRSSFSLEPYRAYWVAWLAPEKNGVFKLLLLAKYAHRAWNGLV